MSKKATVSQNVVSSVLQTISHSSHVFASNEQGESVAFFSRMCNFSLPDSLTWIKGGSYPADGCNQASLASLKECTSVSEKANILNNVNNADICELIVQSCRGKKNYP